MNRSILYRILCALLLIVSCNGGRALPFDRSSPNRKSSAMKHQKSFKLPRIKKWCVATEIQQLIQVDGCQPMTVKNKACVGQCNSHHFPAIYPPDKDVTNRMQLCKCCKPSVTSWIKLSLNCTHIPNVEKLVEVVRHCKCSHCESSTGIL